MKRTALILAALLVSALLAVILLGRSRLTGLPEVPDHLTAEAAGLSRIGEVAAQAQDTSRTAVIRIREGDEVEGLAALGQALSRDPANVALGNIYRMEVYRLKREHLKRSKARGERAPDLPEFLAREPLETLERVAAAAPGREIALNIALAHVDRMVLQPALEIKAPASIDSVRELTKILDGPDSHYVPALVARGLNYLHRPRSLVWPEHPAPPADAASRDLALAVAAGAKAGGASGRLRGIMLMMLGDAHAHEGGLDVARSWWMAARGMTADAETLEEISVRMSWPDDRVAEHLERRLEARMEDQDHPLSDLSWLWTESTERAPS